jgi:hypothetical protein
MNIQILQDAFVPLGGDEIFAHNRDLIYYCFNLKQNEGKIVASQKEGGSGVVWAGEARPHHPTRLSIGKIRIIFNYNEF